MAAVFTETANPGFQYINWGSATATFSDVSIGTASADRIVVVFANCGWSAGASTDDFTIGGTSATEAASSGGGSSALYYLAVPSGTTATIVWTCTGPTPSFSHAGIQVGILTGSASSPTATTTKTFGYDPDPQSFISTLNLPENGVGLAGIQNASGKTPSWSNATAVYYAERTEGNTISAALAKHSTASASWAPTVSGYSYAGTLGVAATWGAAGGASPGSITTTITL